MNPDTSSIIYHLTQAQSLAINNVGVLSVVTMSEINMSYMQCPQDISDCIANYFKGIDGDEFFICSGTQNSECVI